MATYRHFPPGVIKYVIRPITRSFIYLRQRVFLMTDKVILNQEVSPTNSRKALTEKPVKAISFVQPGKVYNDLPSKSRL